MLEKPFKIYHDNSWSFMLEASPKYCRTIK